MKLSKDLFAEIRDALFAHIHGSEDGSARESRRALRVRVDLDVTLVSTGTICGRPMQVKLRNFSASGVCILDWQVRRTGEQFTIHLPRGNGGKVPISCTVRNSRVRGSGLFFTGAEFTAHAEHHAETTPFAQSVEGLASRVALLPAQTRPDPLPGETRGDPRMDVRGRTTLRVEQPDGTPGIPIDVEVCDVSTGGICVLFSREMRAGQCFYLLVNSPAREQIWLQYTVRSCRPIKHRRCYRIGGKLMSIQAHRPTGGLMARLRRLFAADANQAEAARAELEAHLQRGPVAAASAEA
jgi:hypothetical protein